MNALHSARWAFIPAESSERIRRALCNQIRASSQTFETGDTVFYKRKISNKWKDPVIVIGQDGKTKFVHHGSTYVRVPSCRLLKVGQKFSNKNEQKSTESKIEVTDEIIESMKKNLMINSNHPNKQNNSTKTTMNLLVRQATHLMISQVKLMISLILSKKNSASRVLVLKKTSYYPK